MFSSDLFISIRLRLICLTDICIAFARVEFRNAFCGFSFFVIGCTSFCGGRSFPSFGITFGGGCRRTVLPSLLRLVRKTFLRVFFLRISYLPILSHRLPSEVLEDPSDPLPSAEDNLSADVMEDSTNPLDSADPLAFLSNEEFLSLFRV